ncbi:MAG: GNAT family N-acetyltransferase [Vulcanimicrobiaceae bacterium]
MCERDGVAVGTMRCHDYTMNVRGTDVLAGGLGSVAVSLAHKRNGVARAMVAWYLEHYRARGGTFAVLHPFRADFYRALGFGYGSPVYRYRIAPATLRIDGARGTVRILGAHDEPALFACSERLRSVTSGLIQRHRDPTRRGLADVALRWIGVDDEAGTLRGFMQTSTTLGADGTVNRNDLVVRDLQAEDVAYGAALLGYLSAQRDQFARVVLETQDAAFYLGSADPRDGSDLVIGPPGTQRVAETGLGMMYRVLDVERALAVLPPSPERFALRLEISEPAVAPAGGAATYIFGPHGARFSDSSTLPDATMRIGIADFSSLIAGSVRLRDLLHHRLATLEPASAQRRVAQIVDADLPPVCTTRF